MCVSVKRLCASNRREQAALLSSVIWHFGQWNVSLKKRGQLCENVELPPPFFINTSSQCGTAFLRTHVGQVVPLPGPADSPVLPLSAQSRQRCHLRPNLQHVRRWDFLHDLPRPPPEKQKRGISRYLSALEIFHQTTEITQVAKFGLKPHK